MYIKKCGEKKSRRKQKEVAYVKRFIQSYGFHNHWAGMEDALVSSFMTTCYPSGYLDNVRYIRLAIVNYTFTEALPQLKTM